MRNVKTQASQETSEDIKVAEVLHKLTRFGEIVEVPCYFDYAGDVVV